MGLEVLRELLEIVDELAAHLLLLGRRGRGRQDREGNRLGELGAAAEAVVVAQVARHLGRLLIAVLRPLRERAVHDAVEPFRICGSIWRSGGCGSPAMRCMRANTVVSPGHSNGVRLVSSS